MPKLDLQISQPALLLNRIAQRYSRLSRILMEYVDNSLDDAETLFTGGTNSYGRNVKISVGISLDPTCVIITDNCNGMDKKQLTRLIQNVGESMKHSKFTNGQFGFGVHAFRAACKTLTIFSKINGGETYSLQIDRDSAIFQAPEISPIKIKGESGSQVILRDFDKSWTEGFKVTEIQNEIQYHFDGLLRRENLSVTVRSTTTPSVKCGAFDYELIEGEVLRKEIKLDDETVLVNIWVSKTPINNQSCYFTSQGRRINEIYEVKSFMNMSRARYSCWNHPHVAGFIEVGHIIEPVITRDEFRRTKKRKLLYMAVVEQIEPELLKLVEQVNQQRRTLEMGRLGNILSKCFNAAVRKDNHRMEGQATYVEQIQEDPTSRSRKRKVPEEWQNNDSKKQKEEEGKENMEEETKVPETDAANAAPLPPPEGLNEDDKPKEEEKPEKKEKENKLTKLKKVQGRFQMVFVNELKDAEGTVQRSCLIGDDMFINISHPDFQERMMTNKIGNKLMITQRLNSYIAVVAANSYKAAVLQRSHQGLASYQEDHHTLFTELMDLECGLERQLRKFLPSIQKEIGQE